MSDSLSRSTGGDGELIYPRIQHVSGAGGRALQENGAWVIYGVPLAFFAQLCRALIEA